MADTNVILHNRENTLEQQKLDDSLSCNYVNYTKWRMAGHLACNHSLSNMQYRSQLPNKTPSGPRQCLIWEFSISWVVNTCSINIIHRTS